MLSAPFRVCFNILCILNAQQYSSCTCIPMNPLEFVLKSIKNQSQGQFYFPLSFLSSIPFHQTKTNAAMFSFSSSSTPHGLLLQCIVLLRSPVEWTPSANLTQEKCKHCYFSVWSPYITVFENCTTLHSDAFV